MNTIRQLTLIVLAIAATAGIANAQARFGIRAGANLNQLNLKDLKSNIDSDNGCGFTGGVMGEFMIPVVGFGIDISLMYTHMNAEVSKFVDNSIADSNARNFFQVPVNLKYKIGIPVVSPYLFTGPDFAFRLGGEDSILKTKSLQMAWNVGVGIELFNHLQLSGSYAIGINDILKDEIKIPGFQNTNDIKLKNNYWTVTAAWLF